MRKPNIAHGLEHKCEFRTAYHWYNHPDITVVGGQRGQIGPLTNIASSSSQPPKMPQTLPLTRSSVQAAHETIKPFVHRTPVFTSRSLSDALLPGGNTLYFKAENLQKGGAFKFRGASYSLSRLSQDELDKGVCTHSSGQSILFFNDHIA